MGKPTGFLEYQRITAATRPVYERVKDYKEVYLRLKDEDLKEQAARCMDCGIPFCHALGCPVTNLIPEWNDAVYKDQWKEALERLDLTNNFPEITGRVCPAPCEASCTLSINSSPVTIKQIEFAIIEHAFEQGWVKPLPPRRTTGKRIAVIGSGPAGLAAAQELRRAGHSVTIFERAGKLGGILRYGIPDFKLEKWVLDRRLALMAEEGIVYETGVIAGEDISAAYMRRKYDVILITTGCGVPRDLPVQGRGFEGIHFAMEYLTGSNRFVAGELREQDIISARNKNVIVIGGGDTGSDCIGTAKRQGAKRIIQFEIMPKPLEWKAPSNPSWPAWPNILRSSSSHEEGCERDWSIETLRFSGRGVHVEEGHFQRVEWEVSGDGKPLKMKPIPGSEFSVKVDLVLLAMGFVNVEHGALIKDLKLNLDSRGNIAVNAAYMTSAPAVFAAGDAVTGASLVVRSIFHGRQAAKSIHAYLAP